MFIIRLALLCVLTFSAYSFMLSSDFKSMDDQFSIVSNQNLRDTSAWPQLFKEGYFRDHSYYRPLINLSYAVEYQIFGLNPFFYNVDNVIIHIANALLVWMLVAILLNMEIGFWVALLFAIHPIQWESVANISGRAILLSTFFTLGSFIFYLRNQLGFALIMFGFGLLCKESTAILPGILLAYAYFYKRPWGKILWFFPLVGVYMAIRHALHINEFFGWRNMNEAATGFITFLHSVMIDLRLFVFPNDLHFDRSLQLFSSPFVPMALLTITFWLVLGILLFRYRKNLLPLHWLCILWFGMSLAPVSQIVSTIGVQPGFISSAEHFLYVACIPVFICAVAGLIHLRKPVWRMCFIGFYVFFFLTTIELNVYASSELAMMTRSLEIQPRNARLNSSVGLIHAINGRFVQAEGYFRAAVADDSMNPRYIISLGKSVCDQGRYDECIRIYDSIQNPGGFSKMRDANRASAVKLRDEKKQQ